MRRAVWWMRNRAAGIAMMVHPRRMVETVSFNMHCHTEAQCHTGKLEKKYRTWKVPLPPVVVKR